MTYAYWKAALAGEKPKMFVDSPECGFYRSGIYEKRENKARKRVGWTPVAIFMSGAQLTAVIGTSANARMESDRDRINELWSYCAANPISEETYRAVAERGEQWPDSHEETVPSIPVANSSATIEADRIILDDPQLTMSADELEKLRTNAVKLFRESMPSRLRTDADNIAEQIAECKKLLPKYHGIDSDEMSAKARSLQNRFLDLRGEAKKHYDALNAPLLAEQKRIREIWFPLRDEADEASNLLRSELGAWEDVKRKAAKLAQEAAEKAAREHAEAARKAAEANQSPPPAPEPVKSNVPPPASQIRGGAGRAASVSVAVFVTAIDEDKVFAQFKGNPELTALLTSLAQKAIRAGIPVPGATTEERSVVR